MIDPNFKHRCIMQFMSFYRWVLAIAGFCIVCAVPAHADERRKLVFVPGIIGSVLATETGEVVWGDFRSIRGRNFRRLDLLPAAGAPEALVPSDALREIPLIFGAFEVGLYGELIDFLTGETSFFDSRADRALKGDYVEGEDLFVFAYDWRRSNFANAVALNAFIAEHIPEGQYDIIAHSMGGIVSRIMLSGQGPAPLCTKADQQGDLSDDAYQQVCTTIYGAAPDGGWPSTFMDAPRDAGARLHTLVEIAVPHFGSVNLAATYIEGWGKISELLIGSKRDIQDVALSWAAPLELIPTYDNCCARGVPGAANNSAISGLDTGFWMDLVLGFDLEPCPYLACDAKRAIFRNGLANRGRIDAIMHAGLPPHVVANHGLIGRHVKNTREVVYAGFDARGDGDAIAFRQGAEGDGTVHRKSAALPGINQGATTSNIGVVMRAGHPFITGSPEATAYIFHMLVDPIDGVIQPVSNTVMSFARGAVGTVGMNAEPAVMTVGSAFDIALAVSQEEGSSFDRDTAKDAEILVTFARKGGDVASIGAPSLTLNAGASRLLRGDYVYSGTGYSVDGPGVYVITLKWRNTLLAKQFIYVLEDL